MGTGIDFVTCYAPRIFSRISSSSGEGQQLLYTIYVGLAFVLVTPFAILSVDRCGRRAVLLTGGFGMTLSLLGLAYTFNRMPPPPPPPPASAAYAAGWAADASPSGDHELSLACIGLVLAFVGFFSFSWGPVAWIIPSELVPSRIRARVVAVGSVLNWLADYTVVSTFLSLSTALGEAGSFLVYAAINAASLLFVLLLVPETKGLNLEAASEAASAAPSASGWAGVDPHAGMARGMSIQRAGGATEPAAGERSDREEPLLKPADYAREAGV